MQKVIRIQVNNHYHDNFLTGHFAIKKTCELVAHKYYYLILQYNVGAYV